MGKHLRIVLVDDDCDFLEISAARLRLMGYTRTICFSKAAKALFALPHLHIDTIISDNYMKGMSGGRFFSEIRKRDEYSSVKFVAVSGAAPQRWTKNADAFFSKPVDFKALDGLLSGMKGDASDRRMYRRYNINGPISVKSGPLPVAAIRDTGLSGVSFISPVEYPVSRPVTLKIKTNTQKSYMPSEGLIVWKKKESLTGYSYGVRFTQSMLSGLCPC
ncbi:MAG: hypothetical protein A2268_06865 [Candidatus Raymondbacteria bacterium RifOxyA12_full_50_37]|uniref:Response regulatory domain-containing protein n=1 Tax=Candidatus Raymondbacteria bacterium RIFOXYD12_FULL_49_13 TaxID=1817890 RepID=A0A1F7FE56_UNCRA|nr:MAG: hypothetical protein A2268_06865 [Candidatus Raymondbacteria bacterium RifOxyA12_full_50_37]OGJ91108.1 MAG: hypothetical protein A2248_01020 [Candidatus Raymondbacteria bacterium RIFOXYA2_FULL_49_16]OGJ97505.1 MAG: hypothetical protein A2453_01780 [Candidatus Raymondbacteria bacterium RIFOXYC2_FULL_50_21]OGJ99604.1 MAG: hypothetical protein A2487_07800 [Candidatus Raymondbacteria bacterium RifOxyC12_full_50_8]OGK04980.1 MAG: hypothetical protein A2519_09890 [Candidatus Raymondbacteria b